MEKEKEMHKNQRVFIHIIGSKPKMSKDPATSADGGAQQQCAGGAGIRHGDARSRVAVDVNSTGDSIQYTENTVTYYILYQKFWYVHVNPLRHGNFRCTEIRHTDILVYKKYLPIHFFILKFLYNKFFNSISVRRSILKF